VSLIKGKKKKKKKREKKGEKMTIITTNLPVKITKPNDLWKTHLKG